MSGTGDKIVTVKWTLTEANTTARALQAYYAELMLEIQTAGGVGNAPALGLEAGRTETILRRDFDQQAERPRGGRT